MSKKVCILFGIVCIAFGVIIAFLVSKLIDSRPEKVMVESFLGSNPVIAERFGVPMKVKYIPEGSSMEYHSDKTAGKYRFEITGTKASGILRVQWSTHTEHGFRVESIDLLKPPEVPENIWKTQLNPK